MTLPRVFTVIRPMRLLADTPLRDRFNHDVPLVRMRLRTTKPMQ